MGRDNRDFEPQQARNSPEIPDGGQLKLDPNRLRMFSREMTENELRAVNNPLSSSASNQSHFSITEEKHEEEEAEEEERQMILQKMQEQEERQRQETEERRWRQHPQQQSDGGGEDSAHRGGVNGGHRKSSPFARRASSIMGVNHYEIAPGIRIHNPLDRVPARLEVSPGVFVTNPPTPLHPFESELENSEIRPYHLSSPGTDAPYRSPSSVQPTRRLFNSDSRDSRLERT